MDKSQVKSRTSKDLPRASAADISDRQSHKDIDMYCQNHDSVGCSTCIAVDHRLCKDTVYEPEFSLDAANVANKHANIKSTAGDRTILRQSGQKKALGTLSQIPTKTADILFQIKGNQSYNVQVKSDKDRCYITSACYMEDGTIILADNNNRKLKRLHNYNYTVTDYCDLPGMPWQVCMISNTQVAVTLQSQKEVHFISLESKMKTTNKINTDFPCVYLAYAKNNLYISDLYTSIYVYTLSGRKLNHFSKDQSGDKVPSAICSLAVNKDATRIYVGNDDDELIVLDNNGQIITSFSDEQKLKVTTCCYLTGAGSVLVSGSNSNNVLQFTCDGELIGEVIKAVSGKGGIISFCCNQNMTKMFISRIFDDNIEVYDI
ncbi:uncharacterized protein LOC132730918 [Ruditapes philippinarum]|uniref:uncharacterized protein LOC132730918 n=1 Tax=Ruditapes philippinarum TaxID=129788 RepID=UPI00295BB13D|nr:uncharacterized protein LOC132730918 [Ruditapes philippinarum]